MGWFLLIFIGCFFNEIKGSISKRSLQKFSIYSVWAILSIFGLSIFIWILICQTLIFQKELSYSIYSLPFTLLRITLEIILFQLGLLATKYCDRSTYTLVRSFTIPLLLVIDLILGYSIGMYQFIGLGIITLSFIFFNVFHKTLNFTGWKYALAFAVVASFTTTLYKYNITFFENSVVIEWILLAFILTCFFLYKDYVHSKLQSLSLIRRKRFLLQWFSSAIAEIFISYAYIYVNASVGIAIKRWASVIWGIIFWKLFFDEEKFIRKLCMGICIIIWILFLTF